jgi:hypothetical protein
VIRGAVHRIGLDLIFQQAIISVSTLLSVRKWAPAVYCTATTTLPVGRLSTLRRREDWSGFRGLSIGLSVMDKAALRTVPSEGPRCVSKSHKRKVDRDAPKDRFWHIATLLPLSSLPLPIKADILLDAAQSRSIVMGRPPRQAGSHSISRPSDRSTEPQAVSAHSGHDRSAKNAAAYASPASINNANNQDWSLVPPACCTVAAASTYIRSSASGSMPNVCSGQL